MGNDGGDSPLASKSPKSENTRFETSFHDPSSPTSGEEKKKVSFESKFLRTLSSPIMSGLAFANINHVNVEEFRWSPNEKFSSKWVLLVYHFETL